MPVMTNPSFDASNMSLTKHPLYMLLIEGLPEPLTSFRMEETRVTRHGYGMNLYGLSPYGY